MKDVELLPCPFCGGDPFGHEIEAHSHSETLKAAIPGMPDHPGSYVIECACGAGHIDDTREACTARWNRRAAVESDRAQRVPEGWKLVPVDPVRSMVDAAERVDWADSDVRGNIYNMWNVMLASTPAQPAQQEPSPIKAEHKTVTPSGTVVTRLELTDKAKESLRANVTHIPGIAQPQEPPQQERKPMTRAQVKDLMESVGYEAATPQEKADFINGIRHAERHHGIFAEPAQDIKE